MVEQRKRVMPRAYSDDAIFAAVERHRGNQSAAAAELAISVRSVNRRVHARPDLLPSKACHDCGDEDRRTLRFTVSRAVYIGGRHTHAVGGIDLCERCWKAIRAKTPRRRKGSAA